MNPFARCKKCFFFLLFASKSIAEVFPIQFSIPEEKIVTTLPKKEKDFASIIPGKISTYCYENEKDYYEDYQRSYFAITRKKAGWDCMRHYEILANGSIPYFIDLEECDPHTLTFFPKELILEAMHLPGVSYLQIDHSQFDKKRYEEILEKLLDHTRKHLSCRAIANYLLKQSNYSNNGSILFLSGDLYPDYLRCLTFVGLRQLLKEKAIDFPKIDHLYEDFKDDRPLYGKGFSYAKTLPALSVCRENIAERIEKKEFELIIYGSIHRGCPFHDLVKANYPSDQIIYLCGEDIHSCNCILDPAISQESHLFLREFENNIDTITNPNKKSLSLDLFEPRTLVLIIASDTDPAYLENQKIWRTYMQKDPSHIEAYFLKMRKDLEQEVLIDQDTIWVKGEESLIPGILHKTVQALEVFLPRIQREFTHVLRTNLSSFFVFPRLVDFLKTCPRSSLYTSGGLLPGHYSPLQKIYFGLGSGCGFILSKDVAELLVKNKKSLLEKDFLYDDVAIGEFLTIEKKMSCFETARMDFECPKDFSEPIPLDIFHFRIKSFDPSDRVRNERYVFKKLLKKFYKIEYDGTL